MSRSSQAAADILYGRHLREQITATAEMDKDRNQLLKVLASLQTDAYSYSSGKNVGWTADRLGNMLAEPLSEPIGYVLLRLEEDGWITDFSLSSLLPVAWALTVEGKQRLNLN